MDKKRLIKIISVLSAVAVISVNASLTVGAVKNDVTNGINDISFLPDDKEIFTVKPKEENGEIETSMTFEKYFVCAKADSVKSAVFEKSGKVSIKENRGNYELQLGFDDGYETLPWFSVKVYGFNATNDSSLEVTDEGMIFKSDNMDYIEVHASNVTKDFVATKFSTKEKSVQIKAVNDNTLGIYADADKDGIYEKLIADSVGTDYGYYDDSPNKAPDNPLNSEKSENSSKSRLDSDNTDKKSDTKTESYSVSDEKSNTNSAVSEVSSSEKQSTGDSLLPAVIAAITAFFSGTSIFFTSRKKRKKN